MVVTDDIVIFARYIIVPYLISLFLSTWCLLTIVRLKSATTDSRK